MPSKDAIAFCLDPDQTVRRDELVRFFGHNPEPFLKAYERTRATVLAGTAGRPKVRLFGAGLNVAAFFVGPVWFFYRKLWLAGAVILALIAVLALLPVHAPALGLVVSLMLASYANKLYLDHAVKTVAAARRADGTLDEALLRRRGGVSRLAGWIGGSLYVLLMLLAVGGVVLLIANGVAPRT